MEINLSDPRRSLRKLPTTTTLIDRVLLRVEPSASGCWIFNGARSGGYGVVRRLGVNHYCHIVTWEHEHGPVPEGLVLDHATCRNPPCCRPDHLEPVANVVNAYDRSVWKSNGLSRITHCRRGHAWTTENTYTRPDGAGRQCRACIELRWRGLVE